MGLKLGAALNPFNGGIHPGTETYGTVPMGTAQFVLNHPVGATQSSYGELSTGNLDTNPWTGQPTDTGTQAPGALTPSAATPAPTTLSSVFGAGMLLIVALIFVSMFHTET